MSCAPLWQGRRVIVCAGTGGVGKTTVSAAIATAAACAGLKVLVMTIDPARRLAQIFGLPTAAPQGSAAAMHPIDAARLAPFGLTIQGSLTAYLPDVKATFDAVMQRYAGSPEAATRIMDNVIYQNFSTALAGSHEYAAVEALWAVHASAEHDLIVLDTPPSQNVVDFLQAPRRILDFLEVGQLPSLLGGPLLRGRLTSKLMGVGEALVTRLLGHVVGAQTLADVGAFILSMREMYGGFRQRASDVEALLHAPQLAYVLVGTPAPNQQQAMWRFDAELGAYGAKAAAVILNRVQKPPYASVDTAELLSRLSQALRCLGPQEATAAEQTIMQALAEDMAVAQQHAKALVQLQTKLADTAVIDLPQLPPQIGEFATLASLVRALQAQPRRS